MENLKETTIEITVNAKKEALWDLLFNRFGEVTIFNPVIEGSHHTSGTKGEVGCERHCTIDAKTSIVERIAARRGNDSFDIDVVDGGMPMMKTMKATFTLVEINANRTKVLFTMKFNTKPAFMAFFMKPMMKKMLFKMLIGLKYHMETGNPVTKENTSTFIKAYKQMKANEGFNARNVVQAA